MSTVGISIFTYFLIGFLIALWGVYQDDSKGDDGVVLVFAVLAVTAAWLPLALFFNLAAFLKWLHRRGLQ